MIYRSNYMNQICIISPPPMIDFRNTIPISLFKLFHPETLYLYCKYVNNKEEVWIILANSSHPDSAQWQYWYCRRIADKPEMWKALANNTHPDAAYWQYQYCLYVKDRYAMGKAILSNTHANAKYWQYLYLNYNEV